MELDSLQHIEYGKTKLVLKHVTMSTYTKVSRGNWADRQLGRYNL